MNANTISLIESNPELKQFIQEGMERFRHGTTKCDGDDCYSQLTPTTFYVHLTPENNGMLLCVRCLHKYRIDSNIEFKN